MKEAHIFILNFLFECNEPVQVLKTYSQGHHRKILTEPYFLKNLHLNNKKNLYIPKNYDINTNMKRKLQKGGIFVEENLEKEIYKFKVKTGENDKVFGSVSIKQIKEKLDEKYDISKNQIMLDNPLTSLGYHKVCINLYKDINAIINIELTK